MATNVSEAANSALNTSIQRADQKLKELLESVPKALWSIENDLNSDGDLPTQGYEWYIEEVRGHRESVAQAQSAWEGACGKTLEEATKYELEHLEQAATKLIDKISRRIAAVNSNAVAIFESKTPGQTEALRTGYKGGMGAEFYKCPELPPSNEPAEITAEEEPADWEELHEHWDPPGKLSSYAQGLIDAPQASVEGASVNEGSQRLSYSSVKLQIQVDLEQNAIEQKYQTLAAQRDLRAANRNAVREAEEIARELKRRREEDERERRRQGRT